MQKMCYNIIVVRIQKKCGKEKNLKKNRFLSYSTNILVDKPTLNMV